MPGPGHEIVSASHLRDESIQFQHIKLQRKLCGGSACGQRRHRLIDEWNRDGKHGWVDDYRSGYWTDLYPEPVR
jgi:hypothetical protein